MRTFKKYASFQCFMAMAACIMLLALSGCGGGSSNTPVTTSNTGGTSVVSGNNNGTLGLADKAEARQIVEKLPFLNVIAGEDVPALSKGKYLLPAGVSSVVRSSMTTTREITSTFITGMTAYVQATFTLSGTFTFKDSAGAAAAQKPISMQSTGNYVLEKGTNGKWSVIEDAAENLSFSSGNAGSITVQEVHFEPAFAGPGDTQKIEAILSSLAASPELYVVAKISSLGLKAQLVDDGTNGDFAANDGVYTAQYTVPATATQGQHIGLMDIIEKSQSFDLTQDAASAYLNPYTGVVVTSPMIVGTLQSLAISSSATTVDSGGVLYFLAEGTFANGTLLDVTNDVTWKSSDTNAGDVSGPGYFYAGAAGTTTVSAAFGTLTSNAIVITVAQGTGGTTVAVGTCGDTFCDAAGGESTATCPSDCGGGGGTCGDMVCDAAIGETMASCPSDCTGGGGGTGPLPAPVGVSTISQNGALDIYWSPVTMAASYKIYMAMVSGVTPLNYLSLSGGNAFNVTPPYGESLPYTVTALTNGTTYYIVVTSVDGAGAEGPESIEISAAPSAGAGSTCGDMVCDATIGETLALCPSDCTGGGGAAGYCGDTVCDATIGETLALCPSDCTGGGGGYCGDTVCDATIGETLALCPSDCTGGGGGYCGDTVCDATIGETLALCPADCTGGGISAPTNVMTTPGNGYVSLSWNPVATAVSYNIYYASVSGVTAANYLGMPGGGTISTVAMSEMVSGLTNGTPYYFVVTAVGSGVESSESTEVSGIPAGGGNTALKVAGGDFHSCALMSNGTVKCWGGNTNGELGNGSNTTSYTPVNVTGLASPSGIGLGSFHSCAIDTAGSVKCWGNNTSGELGDGFNTSSNVPVTVSALTLAIGVDGGGAHTCAVRAAGDVMCWGNNLFGQLGNASYTDSNVPVSVSGITMALTISTGANHSCAVLSTGSVACWGNNVYGQLGDGTTTISNIPVSVLGISTAVAVKAGEDFTCALLSDTSVTCWGDNTFGQLGDGTNTASYSPVAVSGLTGVTSLSAKGMHACAVATAGASYCWGLNDMGALGDGTYVNSNVPTMVSGVAIGDTAGLGNSHSCLVKTDGTVSCFGYNGSGGLGDGTITNSNVPVAVDSSVYARTLLGKIQYYASRIGDVVNRFSLFVDKVKGFVNL